MTNKIIDFYLSIETVVNGLISLVVSIFMSAVTQLAPLAAPIPPAFSVYTAMRVGLAVPEYIAILAAVAIEITGIFSARTAIRAKHWNDTRLKSDPEAPLVLSISMSAIFFLVVLILSLTIELWPSLVVWVYPGFVVISVTVYTNMGLAMSLNSWEKGKDAVREDRRREAREKRMLTQQKLEPAKPQNRKTMLQNDAAKINAVLQPNPQKPSETASPDPQRGAAPAGINAASKKEKIAARQNEVSLFLRDGKTTSEIAALLHVSPDTIRRDINQLNGKVEV